VLVVLRATVTLEAEGGHGHSAAIPDREPSQARGSSLAYEGRARGGKARLLGGTRFLAATVRVWRDVSALRPGRIETMG